MVPVGRIYLKVQNETSWEAASKTNLWKLSSGLNKHQKNTFSPVDPRLADSGYCLRVVLKEQGSATPCSVKGTYITKINPYIHPVTDISVSRTSVWTVGRNPYGHEGEHPNSKESHSSISEWNRGGSVMYVCSWESRSHYFLPFGEHEEEFVHKRSSDGIRVKLTRSGNKHGPRHATKETKHVGVDPTTWQLAVILKQTQAGPFIKHKSSKKWYSSLYTDTQHLQSNIVLLLGEETYIITLLTMSTWLLRWWNDYHIGQSINRTRI